MKISTANIYDVPDDKVDDFYVFLAKVQEHLIMNGKPAAFDMVEIVNNGKSVVDWTEEMFGWNVTTIVEVIKEQ